MASFPRDQFDDVPHDIERVGAHRVPARRGRGWIAFGWGVLATVALVIAGLLALSLFDPRFELPLLPGETSEPSDTPTIVETAEPITDPAAVDPELLAGLTIAVLNGTPTQGLSNTAADQIAAAGWPNPSRAAASDTTEEQTIVHYGAPELEGIARGLMQLVGAADVQLSDAFPASSITIVLGSDYVPPAG